MRRLICILVNGSFFTNFKQTSCIVANLIYYCDGLPVFVLYLSLAESFRMVLSVTTTKTKKETSRKLLAIGFIANNPYFSDFEQLTTITHKFEKSFKCFLELHQKIIFVLQ